MGEKTTNQQQQDHPSPWASVPWQGQQGYQYYGHQSNGYNVPPPFYQQPYYSAQQRIAYSNAMEALNALGSHNNSQSFPNAACNQMNMMAANVMPPLPPGPPPPLNGQNYQSPTTPGANKPTANTGNNGGFYGQPQNTGFPQIQFNSKTGLGFKPMNLNNNSGGAKKKRKKNKMARALPPCFESAGQVTSFPGNQPPLPKEIPPPFPPLPPPLPSDPPPPPPVIPTSTAPTIQRYNASPMLQTPPKKWGGSGVMNFGTEPWPDSLKAYVNRCYSQCVKDVDKDQVEIILKGKITIASNDGSLWEKNWDFEPLPSLFSERANIEIKKFPKNTNNNPVQRGPPGFGIGKRGRGLSASMGSRLGGFGRGQQRRSKSRSFSPSGRMRRGRTNSRDRSRSPVRKYKKERRSSESSSSSDENFKALDTGKKKRGNGRMNGRLNLDSSAGFSQAPLSKRARKKQKQESKAKSHFYSEFGTLGEVPVNNERLQKRAARFQATNKNTSSDSSTPKGRRKTLNLSTNCSPGNLYQDTMISDVDWKKFHIVGTCYDVDKQYLRQTTAPDASTIRPVEVLRKSLVAVQERWKKDADYYHACDRMKSIRLDLTLQGVRNEFTVKVYETHARIALEKGDHQELNQCLAQLTQLYTEVGGANRLEFTAYAILYYVFTRDTLELTTLLATLGDVDKTDVCIAHAIGVRTAWITNDYHRFFKLLKSAPRMASYAMELFTARERLAGLKIMIKAYRPTLPVSYVTTELGFESAAKCLEFLDPFALQYFDLPKTSIDCKASVPIITQC